MTDALAGRVNAIFDGGSSVGPNVKAGRLRAFAVTSERRSLAFPNIPTFSEQGVSGYSLSVYLGIVAPAGTPTDAVEKLGRALQQALDDNAMRKTLSSYGVDPPTTNSPQEFTRFLREDLTSFSKIAADSRLTKE